MASFLLSSRQNVILTTISPYIRLTQRRWAQVHDTRFRSVATQQSRILEKYHEKLEKKAKADGLCGIEELRDVYKEKIEKLRKESAVRIQIPASSATLNSPNPSDILPSLGTISPPTKPIPSRQPAVKNLSAYLDVEKTQTLPPNEIEAVWRMRNINNPRSLCAVIPLPLYKNMEAMARKYSSFILPIPRQGPEGSGGAEIHYLQWTFPADNVVCVLFTHLAEYKLRGEYSQPHTVITHHLELAEGNSLVLLRGEVMEGRGVGVDEAKWLLLCLQRFYGGLGEGDKGVKRKQMVETFGRGDPNFSVDALVQEAEKIL